MTVYWTIWLWVWYKIITLRVKPPFNVPWLKVFSHITHTLPAKKFVYKTSTFYHNQWWLMTSSHWNIVFQLSYNSYKTIIDHSMCLGIWNVFYMMTVFVLICLSMVTAPSNLNWNLSVQHWMCHGPVALIPDQYSLGIKFPPFKFT